MRETFPRNVVLNEQVFLLSVFMLQFLKFNDDDDDDDDDDDV